MVREQSIELRQRQMPQGRESIGVIVDRGAALLLWLQPLLDELDGIGIRVQIPTCHAAWVDVMFDELLDRGRVELSVVEHVAQLGVARVVQFDTARIVASDGREVHLRWQITRLVRQLHGTCNAHG